MGPEGTPYEGRVFAVSLDFPHTYPLAPPVVRFETPIYHVNVEPRSLRACMFTLGSSWTADTGVVTILLNLLSMLIEPNPTHPMSQTMASSPLTLTLTLTPEQSNI